MRSDLGPPTVVTTFQGGCKRAHSQMEHHVSNSIVPLTKGRAMKRAVGCVRTEIWRRTCCKALRRERQAGVVMAGQPSGGVLHCIICG